MARALALSLISLGLLAGCARERPPAADDVDGLSRFLFKNWEDDRAVSDAMSNLTVWLEGEGQGEEAQDLGFVLSALNEEEIGEGITYPTRTPIEDLIGVAVTHNSAHPIEVHAELVTLRDQTWNARQYDIFDRTLLEGSAEAFLAAEAHTVPEFIRTDNEIEQERLGVRIPYTLRKDYRWVTFDDGRRAVVGRTWAPEVGCSNTEDLSGNCLELSFSIDLFVENGPSETIRLTSSWSKLKLSINLSEQLQIGTLANGIIGIFERTDTFIEEREEEGAE